MRPLLLLSLVIAAPRQVSCWLLDYVYFSRVQADLSDFCLAPLKLDSRQRDAPVQDLGEDS